ncbi:MAG: outer membrane insertion C- signal [Marinoscillum sp.]
MKKLLLLSLLTLGYVTTTNAQELGIRFGDVTGGNVALDALFSTSKSTVIHADASFGRGGLGLDVLWDFLYRPLGDLPLKWYAGVGPSLFLGDDPSLAGMAELGLSYRIVDIPLTVSADWRPTLILVETTDIYYGFFGLNVRYVFN